MRKSTFLLSSMLVFVIVSLAAQDRATQRQTKGNSPARGYVPDAVTAVKIAEAVLVPVYGEERIRSEEPFNANLEGDIWTVSGTLYCLDGKVGMCPGGTATVKISRNDAQILFMIHYK
jgi:hypothetical protein